MPLGFEPDCAARHYLRFHDVVLRSEICPLTSGRERTSFNAVPDGASERCVGYWCLGYQGLAAVSAVEVSVLIPTFRRPELLRAAIGSVLAQQQLAVDVEIVVIDNDPAGSARGAVADLASAGAMELRYVCEPRPGISHARNTGVAASRGGKNHRL